MKTDTATTACSCANCIGAACTCGCQDATRTAASACQCGCQQGKPCQCATR